MICLSSLWELGNLYYPTRTAILSFEKWEDSHKNINHEPNAIVLTLEESKTKMKQKKFSLILLYLCAHFHFTEVTGNELLLFPWEKQRETLSSKGGHKDVTQSMVFCDICW